MKLLQILKRFLKRINTTQYVVIFDIGSASIGGAVVYFDKEIPNITYCTRIKLPFQEESNDKHLLIQIEEILSQVANDIQQYGLQSKDKHFIIPQEIVCVFSSLWSDTQSINASFVNREKFVVTDSIMDNLLAQIHEGSKEEKKNKEVIIEEVVISSLLNGYPTRLPLGKETQSIKVTFLESTISEELNTKISDVIHNVFSPEIPLLLRSFTLVAFTIIRDTFEDIRDFLIVDVTGEITEIVVVHDYVLGDTLSFPYGKNTIVRDIAKNNSSIPEDILSRIKISLSNNIETKESVFKEEERWVDMFENACANLSSETNPIPQNIFLITDSDYEKWFSSMIERVDFSKFIATKNDFIINLLIEKQFNGAYTLKDKVIKDNFLVIDSLFYNREYLARRL